MQKHRVNEKYSLSSGHMPKRIAIAGFGREGQALLRFLKRAPEYHPLRRLADGGAEIWILDKNPRLKLPRGVRGQLGKKYLAGLEKFDIIFRSPGITYELDEFRRARAKGVTFSSATKLFFASAHGRIRNSIGITGTKGKSTTSTLLYTILRAAKKPVVLAGNIGIPMLDLLPKIKKQSLIVLELSSFQLQDIEQSPHIAIVLDMFPDHQNAHRNLHEYYNAKSNIARFQKKDDAVFYLPQNAVSRKIAGLSRGKHIPVDGKNFTIFSPDDLKLKGAHNYMNAVMATTVAAALGVPRKTIQKAVRNFRGLPHRLEFVRAIRRKNREIEFWDDSASSNPGASVAAVRAFKGENYILIGGGVDKNLDYRPLATALKKCPAQAMVLYGENKMKMGRALKTSHLPICITKNLRDAIKRACVLAQKIPLTHSGRRISILLSSGTSSFDMFKNFEERGDIFKKIVRAIK